MTAAKVQDFTSLTGTGRPQLSNTPYFYARSKQEHVLVSSNQPIMSLKTTLGPSPTLLIWLFTASIFVLDAWLVEESNLSFIYLLVIMLGLLFRERNDVVLLGVIATTLTIGAVIIRYQNGSEAPLDQLLFARALSIAGIWTGAYLVITILTMRRDETEQEEQFHALFRFATNGILVTNHRGEIVRVNPATEQLFGYNAEELIGEAVEILIPNRLSRSHTRHRNDYHASPHPRAMGAGYDLYALRKDGTEFPVEVSLSPFHTGKGEFVMAFVVDNTIRKEHEQRIVRQNQKLEQLAVALQNLNEGLEEKVRDRTHALEQAKNDLAAALAAEREVGELKSRFVSMASHEFRTPLSTVLSSAALIMTYADRQDFEQIKKHGLRIKTAVNNLNTILTEFLSLGKLEEDKTEPNLRETDLPEMIEEVISEIRGLFRPGQVLDYQHEGPAIAMLDPALFKHVLLNLFSNAIKYSPENTTIRVRTTITQTEVLLQVIDQGMGIPKADQRHLFSRFFRATNVTNVQGTGLGLYIVKRYVELMNGEIGFVSTEEQGSEFWVKISPQQEK
ncbi:MAG: PAS domain S-box protein [Lewinellaceae bacterium]|nr:PAS domain S-box protein [Lewinellaceae bacterium]